MNLAQMMLDAMKENAMQGPEEKFIQANRQVRRDGVVRTNPQFPDKDLAEKPHGLSWWPEANGGDDGG